MEIQWTLVFFTVLTGCAGWMFLCSAVDAFKGEPNKRSFFIALVALVIMAAGGVASVLHLAHPENMLAALGHPTSGIFVEALLVGLSSLCALIYLVLLKKSGNIKAQKTFVVLAAAFGVLLSFMAGESYMMNSRPVWDTFLLPLSYLGTAAPLGVAAYLCLAGPDAAKTYARIGVAAGLGGIVLVAVYVVWAGINVTGVCALIADIVGTACLFVLTRQNKFVIPLSVLTLCCTLGAAIALRCMMWIISVPIDNFFQML
jgi:DMSO reductase anchor subunit